MGKVKKGLALVLANALYQTQPVLLSCNKDGLDMKAKLEQLDFDVLHYANTTRVATLEAIAEFIKLADLYSVLLVYYMECKSMEKIILFRLIAFISP